MTASKPGEETAAQLLAMAEQVMARARPETAGLWPRAAALLARQALETALDEFWRERGLPLYACATRPQLICLHEYLDRPAAGRIHEAWAFLSSACHHHSSHMSGTVTELDTVIREVRSALEAANAKPGVRNELRLDSIGPHANDRSLR